jgi:hypothetical protein
MASEADVRTAVLAHALSAIARSMRVLPAAIDLDGGPRPVGVASEAPDVQTVGVVRGPSVIAASMTVVPVVIDLDDGPRPVGVASEAPDVPTALPAHAPSAIAPSRVEVPRVSGAADPAQPAAAGSGAVDVPTAVPARAASVTPAPVATAAAEVVSRVVDARNVLLARGRLVIARSRGVVDRGLPSAAEVPTGGSATQVPPVVAASPVVVASPEARGLADSTTAMPVPVHAAVRGPAVVVVSRGAPGHARSATGVPVPVHAVVHDLAGAGSVPTAAAHVQVASVADRPEEQGREVRVTRPVGHRSPDSPAAARASALPRVAAASAPCRAAAVAANHGPEDPGVRVEVGEAAVGAEPAPASPG